jgi:hypothetical protein
MVVGWVLGGCYRWWVLGVMDNVFIFSFNKKANNRKKRKRKN